MKECDVCVCEVLPFTYLSLLCTCWCVVVVNDKYDMFKGLALFLFFCFSDPRLHVSHFESPVMLS